MNVAVIFDMDGPLLRLSHNEEDAYIAAIMGIYGNSRISILWDEYPIRTDTEITKHIIKSMTGRKATHKEIKKICEKYARNLNRKLREGNRAISTPGVISLLQNLSTQMILGVATGNFREIASIRLRSAGLWRFCRMYCEGSGDGGTKTEILKRLIKSLPKTVTRIIFVGDSVSDLRAAKYCAAEFIGFSESENRRKDLSLAGCEFVARSHAETEAFLWKKLATNLLNSVQI